MERNGPITTFGHISALGPNDLGDIQHTDFYLADITAAHGMSGSPAFLSDGTVIGILFGGKTVVIDDHERNTHVLPQGFAYALPLHNARLTPMPNAVKELAAKTCCRRDCMIATPALTRGERAGVVRNRPALHCGRQMGARRPDRVRNIQRLIVKAFHRQGTPLQRADQCIDPLR